MTPSTSSVDRALERVQDLYVVQTRLIKLLESDLSDPVIRRQTHASLKEFQALLNRVDQRYMGGEEVWASLMSLPSDVMSLLRRSPVSVRSLKAKASKKPVKAKPAKKPAIKSRVSTVKAGKKKSRR